LLDEEDDTVGDGVEPTVGSFILEVVKDDEAIAGDAESAVGYLMIGVPVKDEDENEEAIVRDGKLGDFFGTWKRKEKRSKKWKR
jgi:hypothetical protein